MIKVTFWQMDVWFRSSTIAVEHVVHKIKLDLLNAFCGTHF